MDDNTNMSHDLSRNIIKLVISIVILVGFKFLVSFLIFLRDISFFNTALNFSDVVIAVINGVIVFLICKFAFYLERDYKIDDFSWAIKIVKWLIFIIGVIIAYAMFHPIMDILGQSNNFNLTFLVVTLIILARSIILIFSNIDKITDLFAGRVKFDLSKAIPKEELKPASELTSQNGSPSPFLKRKVVITILFLCGLIMMLFFVRLGSPMSQKEISELSAFRVCTLEGNIASQRLGDFIESVSHQKTVNGGNVRVSVFKDKSKITVSIIAENKTCKFFYRLNNNDTCFILGAKYDGVSYEPQIAMTAMNDVTWYQTGILDIPKLFEVRVEQ